MKTMSEKPEQMPDNVTDRPLVTFALFAYNKHFYQAFTLLENSA